MLTYSKILMNDVILLAIVVQSHSEVVSATNAPFVVPRFQSLTEVPVWEVLQSRADRNHGALRGRKVHLNEHSGWIQVRVTKFPCIK